MFNDVNGGKFKDINVPRHCPLVLLVKVSRREVRAFEVEMVQR
jgi:hypothetical protein